MPNSNRKGKAGELEAAEAIHRHWGADAYRSQQYAGTNHDADLAGVDGLHIEVKRYAKIAPIKWLRQAERDTGGATPVVIMREDGDTEPVVMMRVKDVMAFAESLAAIDGRPIYPSRKEASGGD